MVKLNNPLMGTETVSEDRYIVLHRFLLVKLNNPLMGTETDLEVVRHYVEDMKLC